MGNGCTSVKTVGGVEDEHLFKLKFVIVGDSSAGKTSVVERFEKNHVSSVYVPTKHVNIVSVVKKINVPNHGIASVELWDIPGHEGSNIWKTYFCLADAIIVVVDLSCDDALGCALEWKNQLEVALNPCHVQNHDHQNIGQGLGMDTVPVLLLGNKFDLAKKAFFLEQYSMNNKKHSYELTSIKNIDTFRYGEGSDWICTDQKSIVNVPASALFGNPALQQNVTNETEIKELLFKSVSEATSLANSTTENMDKLMNTREIKLDDLDTNGQEQNNDSALTNGVTEHTFHDLPMNRTFVSEDFILPINTVVPSSRLAGMTESHANDDEVMKTSQYISESHSAEISVNSVNGFKSKMDSGQETLNKISLKTTTFDGGKGVDDVQAGWIAMGKSSNVVETEIPESLLIPSCVEILEEFAMENGFIGGIPVSATGSDGGVHEAIQSLIRHILKKEKQDSERKRKPEKLASNNLTRTRKNHQSTPTENYAPLEEVGLTEIDEEIRSCDAPMKEALGLSTLYSESVHYFKKVCLSNGLVDELGVSLEECISAMKRFVEDSSTDMTSRVVAEDIGGYLLIDVVGDRDGNAVVDDDIALVLQAYKEQIHGPCCLISSSSLEVEEALRQHLDRIKIQEQKAWDVAVASGLGHSAVKAILAVIAQDKARLIASLEQMTMTRKAVETLQSKIRATLLF